MARRLKWLLIGCSAACALISQDAVAGQKEIPAAATTVAEQLVAAAKHSAAVVDFTDLQGNVTELGRFVAEELALGLVTSNKNLSIVDRTHLRALMQENKLGTTGLIDPTTARRLGQIVGVEALVTGTITPFADSVRVVVKVLDAATARILGAASVDIAKTKTIEELLARDIRGVNDVAISRSADTQSSGGSSAPAFQSDRLRVSLTQFSVAPDNRRAVLSLVVENVSREPLHIAFENLYSNVALADDRASQWSATNATGLNVAPNYSDLRAFKEEHFTLLGVSERINVIVTFQQNVARADTPGTIFTFSANTLLYATPMTRRISIGLRGITPTAVRR